MLWVLSSRFTGESPFHRREVKKGFYQDTEIRSEVVLATLELIKKEQRKTQASVIFLKNDGAKDYKTQNESAAGLAIPIGNPS